MLSDEDIKQIFFYTENNNPNGFYANDVDVLEFGNKIADFVTARCRRLGNAEAADLVFHVKPDLSKDDAIAIVRAVEKFYGIK